MTEYTIFVGIDTLDWSARECGYFAHEALSKIAAAIVPPEEDDEITFSASESDQDYLVADGQEQGAPWRWRDTQIGVAYYDALDRAIFVVE